MSEQNLPSLRDVQAAFAHWRASGTPRRTPPALRAQAVSLLSHHRISEVINALGLDHRRLSRWRRALSASEHAVPVNDFIALPMASDLASALPIPSSGVALTLTRQAPDGSAISISGQLSDAQWRWALRLLRESEA